MKTQGGVIPIGHQGAMDLYVRLGHVFLNCSPRLLTVLGWGPWKQSLAKVWLDAEWSDSPKPRPAFMRRYS